MPDVHVSRAGYLAYYFNRRRRKRRTSSGTSYEPLIQLSASTLSENASAGDLWGLLTTDDTPPDWGTSTYSIDSDPDTVAAIDGNRLELEGTLDYEAAATHLVTVMDTPSGPYSPVTREFVLHVTDDLEVPDATWVSGPADTPIEVSVLIPDGVAVAGDPWVWQFDTVNTFDSVDLEEINGTLSAEDAVDHEIDASMPSLADGLWYARFQIPGKTAWSDTISQTINTSGDTPFRFDSTIVTFDSTTHTFDETGA